MEPYLCACDCGTEIRPGSTYAKGHYQRGPGGFHRLPPEAKTCERCGRIYRRAELRDRQSNKHWARRRYCSRRCQEAALSEFAKAQRGEKSPVWKGDGATAQAGRKRAREMYPYVQPCEVCGAKGERHHKDGDTLNNDPSNIAWLCRKHHIGIEDRNAYKRKPMTPERLERKRALARARRRRYNERKRREARKTA